jgi:hypothetical protein
MARFRHLHAAERHSKEHTAYWRERSDGRPSERYYSSDAELHKPNQDWEEYGFPLYPDLPMHVRHFPLGESHVRYTVNPVRDDGTDYRGQKVYKDRGGHPPEFWSLHHEGVWQGHLHGDKPDGSGQYDFSMPTYRREKDGSPENHRNGPVGKYTYFVGQYSTAEEAQAAAEGHFAKHYRPGLASPDYYDQIMNHLDEPQDGYDIFGDRP